jgi:DNA-binding transcriptional ArsR family regulator
MPDRPLGIYLITRPEQHAALASPVRQEIVDSLAPTGVCSIAEIAAMLARSPHSLYHHVRALVRVGLVLKVGERKVGRRIEALYAAPGRRLQVHYDMDSSVFIRNLRRQVSGTLRLTERDFHRGLVRREDLCIIPRVNLWAGRLKGRLSASQLREVNRLMRKIWGLFSDHPQQTEGELHALTMVIVPLRDGASPKQKRVPARRE